MLDEKAWIEAAVNGDVEAFTKLVKKYSNAIYSVAFSVIGDFHLAQDIAQETFIKAFKHLPQLQSPEKFGSWLYSIAQRLSIDWKRKQTSEQAAYKKVVTIHNEDTFDETIERREIQKAVWAALNELEEKNRVTAILYHINGLSMKEIGDFLNISFAAVESRLRRSRKVLKQYIMQHALDMFSAQRLGQEFAQMVAEEIVKRAGQFYIPVTDKKLATDWYRDTFGLELDRNGQLVLSSGQTMFLLEVSQAYSPYKSDVSPKPFKGTNEDKVIKMTFAVDNLKQVYSYLLKNGVQVSNITYDSILGEHFIVCDLDGNLFSLFQPN